jgi:hypothetical protein
MLSARAAASWQVAAESMVHEPPAREKSYW